MSERRQDTGRKNEMKQNDINRLVELMIASALAAIVAAWLLAFASVWLWTALT